MSANTAKMEPVKVSEKENENVERATSLEDEQQYASPEKREIDLENADQALGFVLQAHLHEVEIDPRADRRLLWKIDIFLTPLMCLLYCIQYLDKTAVNYTSIVGLRQAFHMEGIMYSWVGSSFYLGYLGFVFFTTRTLQYFPVAKACVGYVVIWGLFVCLLAAAKNYPGFIALRTLMGGMESAVTPAFVIITSQWYKKEEQFFRTSLWLSFNGLGQMLGGSIGIGVYRHQAEYSIAAWKVYFLICGVATIILGFLVLFHIPDTPVKAWFLNEKEKVMVVQRIRGNNQGFGNSHFKWYQFKEAMIDIRTWLYFIYGFCSDVPNGGLTNFSSLLMTGMGYNTVQTFGLGIGQGGTELTGLIVFGLLGQLSHQRMVWAVFVSCLTLIGICMLAFASQAHAQVAGIFLFTISPVGMVCLLSCISSNCAGHTKKTVVNAVYLAGYCVGNIVGPQTFKAAQAPTYTGAKVAMVVCQVISVVDLIVIWIVNFVANKRRDKYKESLGDTYIKVENSEFADLTDFENPDFRYSL